MLPTEKSATRVGAAVSALLLAAVVLVLRIDFRDLGPSVRVQVYLRHPGPLRASADVQLAGRKIGRVDSVHLVTANQARALEHPLHPQGGVLLSVLVRKKYLPWVRQNSELFVNSKGLIGESYLEVAPPPAVEEMQRPLRDGDSLRGIDPARMEEIIVTSFLNARRFGALLEELAPDMNQLRADLDALGATLDALSPETPEKPFGKTFARARSEFEALRTTVDLESLPSASRLHDKGRELASRARSEFGAVAVSLDALSAKLDAIRARVPPDLWLKLDSAIRDAEATMARLDRTISNAQTLAAQVSSGIGSVGALMNDKEFSDDAKKIGRYIKRHPWKLVTRPIDN